MKKTIYIFASIIFGVILSFLLHAFLEFTYLEYAKANSIIVKWNGVFGGSCSLPPCVQVFILILGVIFGYFLGQRWWQIVYVEKRTWPMRERLEKVFKKLKNK